MELIIIVVLGLIVGETTYLTYKTRPKNKIDKQSLLIDTSVLIDGRILPIARSGLITAPMIIPRSVIRELQYMADKADHDKRERAREGLDMIEQLQRIEGLTITVIDDKSDETGVDERLVELASTYGARLCTIDYNLNKSARAQNVAVVNINELAHALRIVHLPGEIVAIKIVQPGQESRQGVGYLDDGTMVVVDDAKAHISQTVQAEVTRVLQTTAGKMMFARLVADKASNSQARESTQNDNRTAKTTQLANSEPRKPKSRGSAQSSSRDSRVPRATESDGSPIVDTNAPAPASSLSAQSRAPLDSSALSTTTAEATRPAPARKPYAQRKPRSRRSPEDALVDLANNEE